MLSVDSVIVKLYDSNHQVDNYLNGRKMNLVNDLKSGIVTLNQLKTELGISVKEYPDAVPPRIVLNYCQIESPKSHPYVMQSRGLILNSENFDIMCLPFDRFFNFGEVYDHSSVIDFSKAECREKIDGSLIKIYHDGYKWCIATRGTAFAESTVGGYPLTFKDLVLKALGFETDEEFQLKCLFKLTFLKTYLFEVTSRENRVVTHYSGYDLWWLGTRCHLTGKFENTPNCAIEIGAKIPKVFKFDTVEQCMSTAASLPDLQEGYVLYQDGIPICKIKSPAYVAVHHIKSEGLNPKRIAQLVLANEQGEYLTYFGEDYQYIEPYEIAFHKLKCEMVDVYNQFKDLESQKDFALSVKDYPYSSALFKARGSNGDVLGAFDSMATNFKIQVLEKFKIE